MKYTVNTKGNNISKAKERDLHAYYSKYTNVTAVEVEAKNKTEAKRIVQRFAKVLYVFL